MLPEQNGKPERAAVYCRVSSDEQAQAKTIDNQIDFARRYTDLHGLIVHGYYQDEGVSGTLRLEARPDGARLMADARAGKFNVVLVYKLDRFARRLKVLLDGFEVLDGLGIALRSMTESFDTSTPIGRLFMQMMGSFAEYERETILQRTALGKQRAVRDGRWLGGIPPLGYKVVDKRLVVDEEEAATVRRLFHLYVHEDMGTIPLADLLNAEGVPTLHGSRNMDTKRWPKRERRWASATLSNILRCTAYAGIYQAGRHGSKEITEYDVPPIIDRDTFEAAQRLLRDRFIEASRNARRLYLLRGLIRCHCGGVIAGEGKQGTGYYYYSCHEKGHFRQRAELLEGSVWAKIRAFARDPGDVIQDLRERMQEQAQETGSAGEELEAVAAQIAAKQREQDAVIALYRKGRISEQQLDRQLDELSADLSALEARREAVFSRQSLAVSREAALLSAEGLLERLRERVDQIEADAASDDPERVSQALADKRELIKGLVDRIDLTEDGQLMVTYCFSDSSNMVPTLL